MKSTILAVAAGVIVFLVSWWVGTAILPASLLMPVGALALLGAFTVANIVSNLDD